jgi:hypothetical protein
MKAERLATAAGREIKPRAFSTAGELTGHQQKLPRQRLAECWEMHVLECFSRSPLTPCGKPASLSSLALVDGEITQGEQPVHYQRPDGALRFCIAAEAHNEDRNHTC